MFLHLILFTVGAGGVHSPRQIPSGSSSGSEGAEGAMPPHSPVKISHKKDGRRRQPYRFHVSRPPPYPAAGSATG